MLRYLPSLLVLIAIFIPDVLYALGLPSLSLHLAASLIHDISLYMPAIMRLWLVFILGIIQDSVSGGPLGFHALLWCLWRQILYFAGGKLERLPFGMHWLLYGVLITVQILGQGALLHWDTFDASVLNTDILLYGVLSWLCYPLVILLLHRLYKNDDAVVL